MNDINSTKKGLFSLFFLTIFFFNNIIYSQKNFTLYSLNETSQAINLNPGFKQKNRFYISVPLGMQSFSLAHSGFTLNNLIETRPQDDSLTLNPGKAIAKMAKTNFINVETYNEIFGLGFKIKKGYLTVNVTNRFQTRFNYPKDLFKLGFEGNGKTLLGNRASLDGLGADVMSYMEYGVGYNRTFFDKLTLGVRVKALSGIANVQTKKSQLGLTTDASTFDLTVDGAMQVNTSNISQFSDTTYDPKSMVSNLFNFKNLGLTFDLGASYQLNEKIELSSSLLDLGFIKWKSNVTNYNVNDAEYTFKGIDFQDIIDSVDIGKKITDTLSEIFSANSNNDSYSTALHSKFYLGGKYKINNYFSTGILMYNEIVAKRYSASGSLYLTAQLRNWLSVSVNYSTYARSYNNIGFGFNVKTGPIQLYLMSDNIMAIVNYEKAKTAHVCFGMSVVIGPRKDKDKDGIVNKKDDCPTVAGLPVFNGCPDRDNDSIIDKNDSCPDIAGLKMFNGCPDRDKDSIMDKNDSCPDITGLKIFNGCPDRDKDGIMDSKDDCPEVAGLAIFKGCPDTDKDGIVDSKDKCPDKPGLALFEGCPDTDKDGIKDNEDACPDIAGLVVNKGCPDTDNDGIVDVKDNCPTVAGPKENVGCPWVDTDLDGILDKDDKCPSVKGVIENQGCPKIEIAAQKILKQAFDNLEFNSGNAIIKNTSNASLDKLAGLLVKSPTWKLEITGHTDDQGDDKVNMLLSQKRAEAVKVYLVSKGVSSDVLRTFYFGETKPIADNATEVGRQKNRRVEMTVAFE